jgi:excisionase family DNA binding protein
MTISWRKDKKMQTTISRLWGVRDVAEYLGVPVKTLYEWRRYGRGPRSRRVGKHLRYDPEHVRTWFESLDDQS